MSSSSHDFVTVDMRSLKAALVASARVQRISVSVLVRRAVARELGEAGVDAQGRACPHDVGHTGEVMVKLSIRLTASEAEQLAAGARSAGLARGAYVAGLVHGVPVLGGGARKDLVAALTASCAELASLSRNVHHLTALLRQGEVRAAQEYRAVLDTLAGDVRQHLGLAAGALADLRPSPASKQPVPTLSEEKESQHGIESKP